ncbi:cupin domain-containing protein [Saccharibacillus sp. CPCC 101409]|uniref:cupin domain-containing protein n=1 Tax=Saccharibacillus sp. CPCC 101409 TaxID=3058041 RepID=UPI002673303B|nr:cupin domain-containing protein [Saccharibacillus sp. CPCC 101409]MDO3413190.1 cupin domain-containing protein [Saccharibacillus sp. CPCC 101409]
MQKSDLTQLQRSVTETYRNFVVGEVNESCLRMSVFTGQYKWHRHPESDELFMVLEGALTIEFRHQAPVVLGPGEILTVPKGVAHRTSARERTVNLCFEYTASTTVFEE